jgi:peptidoglycan hydrolase CwlO-like protein|tara:strand:+ start:2072 stop:2260 length:189 start_codon:yes stop_codon:yes gene_type:complete
MNITPLEQKRLQNINFIMEDIHDSVNEIYETLVDQEYDETRKSILTLNSKLKTINESINDEL